MYRSQCELKTTARIGKAARLAAVDRIAEAQEAFELAITYWTKLQKDNPFDVSRTQALVVLQGKLADLHWNQARRIIGHAERAEAISRSCAAYANSIRNLKKLPGDQASFPTRYSWSPDPDTIFTRFEDRC